MSICPLAEEFSCAQLLQGAERQELTIKSRTPEYTINARRIKCDRGICHRLYLRHWLVVLAALKNRPSQVLL